MIKKPNKPTKNESELLTYLGNDNIDFKETNRLLTLLDTSNYPTMIMVIESILQCSLPDKEKILLAYRLGGIHTGLKFE